MKEIKVVIGKNFGDEGKGMTVDSLCKNCNALVIRHNGGAQAGHTVEESTFRFVFHQLGSGSRWGCPTYWSRTFLPDLLKLSEEAESFKQETRQKMNKDVSVKVYADPNCACTTVYDVLLNSLTEQLRGKDRHGSCGMGIYEAVLRSRQQDCCLYLKDFISADCDAIVKKLFQIRQEYVYPRLEQLGKQYAKDINRSENQEWVSLIKEDNLLMNAARIMYENFREYITLKDAKVLFSTYDRVVFENAQGLLLDEENKEYYPHLTPSHTGLCNVVELMRNLYYADAHLYKNENMLREVDFEAIYVTRTYVTRHGAGRLDYECRKEDINEAMIDLTNVPNPWQQQLRYAKHPDFKIFFQYMEQDFQLVEFLPCKKKATLMVTHLDETQNRLLFYERDLKFYEFVQFCRKEKGIKVETQGARKGT
ncbi:MAG TPA: adenylosuccinate synthetase [Lachnospiraceae bacterium]|nr:adenylosuccinate synthetase [Lachnospiraceae bacterium]